MKFICAIIAVVLFSAAVVSFFQYITEDDEYEKRKIKIKGFTYIFFFALTMSVMNVVL